MVLSAPTLKSPTTSRSTVPTVQASSATSSTQNLRQPYRRGSKGGFQTPAVDQDLALPDRVLEAILEHLAKEVVLETAPIVKHDNLHRPAVSRESSQTNAKTGSNQELLLRFLSLSKTTKCMAERALYLSPTLQNVDSLRQFTESVQLGESRWDSLKNTPYSTPGRYVTVLDLRRVLAGHPNMDRSQARLIFYACLTMLFASLPNLKELYLPEGCGTLPRSVLEALQESPCIAKVRVLHGLEVTHRINAQGIDPLVQLLAGMKELQSLKICGLGAQDEGLDARMLSRPQPTLALPKLRKLHISAVRNGLLLAALKDSELPALVKLQTNTYHLLANDLTHPFMVAHGKKLSSLTIHAAIDWPPIRIPAHPDILAICPNLREVFYLDSTCPPPPDTFGMSDWSSSLGPHPLRELTIARWSTNANLREITPEGLVDRLFQSIFRAVVTDVVSPIHESPRRNSASATATTMSALSLSPGASADFSGRLTNTILPDLEVIRFHDFTWLRPDLGPAALGAGVNGLLRRFSSRMAGARRTGRPIRVVDMHGNECPPIFVPGSRGGIGARGGQDPRFGLRAQQERRRASFDDELDG